MSWESTADTIHRDDIKVVGHLDRSVAYIEIDWQAVERRATEEIRTNIARRLKREQVEKDRKALADLGARVEAGLTPVP